MPRRNYKISDRKEGEIFDDLYDDVDSDALIRVFSVEENNGDGGRYLLGITDTKNLDKNLDNTILFGVTINADGRITDFRDFTFFPLYSKIKLESSSFEEVDRKVVSIMGNDLGSTLYTISLKHRYVSKAVEFEIKETPIESLSFIQEPPDMPWQTVDEEEA
jgi:hypothetical protein